MRIVLLPGIWPPDVGGPATHGPDLARFLVERGHRVHVLTMGDGPPTERPCPVEVVSRSRPFPVRYGRIAARGTALARKADVIYASATYAAAAAASAAARRPLVVKLVSDPAYERARRYGLFGGSLEAFQEADGRVAALKAARTLALRRARRIVVPSAYLADLARRWRLDPDRVEVIPNPAPPATERAVPPPGPGGFVFVGRLTAQKDLTVALDAVAAVPESRLVLVGDGPERAALEAHASRLGLNGRVEFAGSRPRDEVLDTLAGAWALVLPSAWENLPHAAVEALAVGTPVVATAVGGVPEVVRDGVNGLLVPAGGRDELAAALRRLVHEDGLRERLAAAARTSVEGLSREAAYGRLEEILAEVAR